MLLASSALHRGRVLPEQDAARLRVDRRHVPRIDLLGTGVGALRGRPRSDGLEPALQVREVGRYVVDVRVGAAVLVLDAVLAGLAGAGCPGRRSAVSQ